MSVKAVKTITELEPNQVFVFGSNTAGRHGAGAAYQAMTQFGAVYGVGKGPTGQCYAIPTKNDHLIRMCLGQIKYYFDQFVEYAKEHPELEFLLTPIGTGLAGYTFEDLESILPVDMPTNITKCW